MSIEKLKTSLLSEAQKEADGITSEARAQSQKMLEEERSKIQAVKAVAEKDVVRLLDEERNERMAWARLEAKRINAEAKEDAIKVVLDDFMETLAGMRKSAEYKRFLKHSVETAATELGAPVIAHVRSGDKDTLSKMKGVTVVEDLEGLGGALVESENGMVRVNLTLETLVETRRDELRSQIYERLGFGGGK